MFGTKGGREYLMTVRTTFENNREKYDEFLKIMKDFRANRIDHISVRSQVRTLFEGHEELIVGLNQFLPKRSMKSLGSFQRQDVTFADAIDYVFKVKARFEDDDRPYKSFLAILKMYTEYEKNHAELYDEICVIFRDQDDLREGFAQFLPR
ncbi:unnamed protein product [Microthlaspi erraticum]|uniref:Uncharacterized protein n=1 Tax=Microthlaspi erraticum TaxID=1685480 RepID=A0A6D2HEK0_9BRAS|nr:unnamed protein product [Microthlaspi erraticum]CAA7057657.1 unnamed protein product [Microthlaspi erraticum]